MALKIKYNSPVVLTFSLASMAVFLLSTYLTDGYIISNYFVLNGVWDWGNPLNYFRLFSYTLGHANPEHIVGNMSIFLLIAPIMEEKYGSRNIAIMMLITTLVTGIFQVFLFDTGLLGASGLVFMFIVLVSFADAQEGSIPLTFILVVIFFMGKEILGAMENNNISEYAHVAGGFLGAFFGFNVDAKNEIKKGKRIL